MLWCITYKIDDSDTSLVALPVVFQFVGLVEIGDRGRLLLQSGCRTMDVLSVLLTSRPNHLHGLRADNVIHFVAGIQLATEEDDRLAVAFETQSGRQVLSPTVETVQLRRRSKMDWRKQMKLCCFSLTERL